MILGNSKRAIAQGLPRALSIEPGWGDESGRFPAGDILDQRPPLFHSARRLVAGKTEKFAFACCRCRANENGPAFIVNVSGLRDRVGRLKLEVYPANNDDFLEDDNVLVSAGKTFRRVEVPVPQTGSAELCIRVPRAGRYSVVLVHDRNSDRRFNWRSDGVGFAGNPRLGMSQPSAEEAMAVAGSGRTRITIVLNYLRGLRMRPLESD